MRNRYARREDVDMITARGFLVGCLVAAGLNGLSPVSAKEEIVVEVESALDVAAYLEKIGFHDINNHPERLESVPCTRVERFPEAVPDLWVERVPLRKSVYYRLGLSGILQVNAEILAQRERLLGLSLDNLTDDARVWVSALMARYGIAETGEPLTEDRLAELVRRVDVLPPSLIIVQGAIESGWLQSRFAREGQALFGQWTTSESGLKALESDVRLASFDTPRDSLIAYLLNINTNRAYQPLRKARAEMRREGRRLDSLVLAGYLTSYAETGGEYVSLIRSMIRRDDLTRADTARLEEGPCVLFRHIGHR